MSSDVVGAELASEVARRYGLHAVELVRLDVPVNDVVAVTAEEGNFALKLYHRARTPAAVRWELALVEHLAHNGAPVVRPIPGPTGLLQRFVLGGREQIGGLFTWAAETKPAPGPEVYRGLGAAAGASTRPATASRLHRTGRPTTLRC